MKSRLQFSERVTQIPQALSVYINQLVYTLRRRQKDIIALSLGEAFFEIPRFDISRLDFDKGYHYSDSQGIPELRKKVVNYYKTRYNADIDPDREIIISAGSKPLIFMCMQAVLNPGDNVVIHEPAWLSYKEQALLVGATVQFMPFDADYETYFADIPPRTKLLIINNPNNPAGRVYSRDELLAIHRLCLSRGIFLLVDEAYSDFVLNEKFYSLAHLVPDKEGILVVNSLSKNMGMSGWRVGYVIAQQNVIQQLLKLNQHLITCAPTLLMLYMAEYFDDVLAYTLPQVKLLIEKRQRVAARIAELGLKTLPGGATFYFFVDVDQYAGNIHDLALYLLLEKGIAVVPGEAYGASVDRYVRVSIGTESEERIDEALQVLLDTLMRKDIDPVAIRGKLEQMGLPQFQA